jgi:hypothetical protein
MTMMMKLPAAMILLLLALGVVASVNAGVDGTRASGTNAASAQTCRDKDKKKGDPDCPADTCRKYPWYHCCGHLRAQ